MPASRITHRAAKSWHKITLTVDPRLTEAVGAFLADLSGAGLEISAPGTGRPQTRNPSGPDIITAYIPAGPKESDEKTAARKIEELHGFLAGLSHFFPECQAPVLCTEIIMEEDWGQTWKEFFTSFQITPALTIKPSWENTGETGIAGGDHNAVIVMDPGLAFGTGHHASTQLALLLLEELFRNGKDKPAAVLDVGTGSSILAMACALFGAESVVAIDNDPDAVETATQNVIRNRLDERITVSGRDVVSLQGEFDLVAANITHDILVELASSLAALLRPGGFLVLSGILKGDQERTVKHAYSSLGLTFSKSRTRDEWAALLLQKKA